MTNPSIPIASHYIALVKLELNDESLSFVENLAQDLISDLDLNVVKKISHVFHPNGITLAFVLSESHLLIHTWPELGIMHLDLVTCSHRSESEFNNSIRAILSDQKIKSIDIKSINFD